MEKGEPRKEEEEEHWINGDGLSPDRGQTLSVNNCSNQLGCSVARVYTCRTRSGGAFTLLRYLLFLNNQSST